MALVRWEEIRDRMDEIREVISRTNTAEVGNSTFAPGLLRR